MAADKRVDLLKIDLVNPSISSVDIFRNRLSFPQCPTSLDNVIYGVIANYGQIT